MPEESVQKRGVKWAMVVILVSVFFAGLFMLGYFTNIYKRGNVPINADKPYNASNSN